MMASEKRLAKIEEYGRGYDLLIEVLKQLPKEMWQFKPSPKDWSVHEIIIHLADSETNSYLRARRLIAEPGQPLTAYDQDVWAEVLDYHQQSTDEALQILQFVRLTTYKLLKTLPEEVWSNTVVHPEYDEPYSFTQWLEIYADHIPNHIEQMKENQHIWNIRHKTQT